jgi:hypothetical protein
MLSGCQYVTVCRNVTGCQYVTNCQNFICCHSGVECEFASLCEWFQTFLNTVVLSKRLEIVQRQSFKCQTTGLTVAPCVVIQ